MTYYIKLGLVLFLIAAIASGILAFVNGFTRPIIEENKRQLEIQARQVVLPAAETFEYIEDNLPYYTGLDEDGNIVGYTFLAISSGYSGVIQTMVGVSTDFIIQHIAVISQSETPGLGANCVRPEFVNQYRGRDLDGLVLDKDGGEIVTITGATITTRALNNSVRGTLQQLQEQISKGATHTLDESYEEVI